MPTSGDGAVQHRPDARLTTVATTVRHNPVEEVVARLGLAIDLGLLAPGEKLPHQESLATTFNVSPTTVRRALTRLCSIGLLERRRGRTGGTFVAPVPPRHVLSQFAPYRSANDDLIAVLGHRRVIECGNVVLAANRATASDVKRLRSYAEAMDRAESWPDFRAIDPRFHLEIAAIAGSSGAVRALSDLLTELYQFYVPYPIEYLHQSNAQHWDLVKAIEARDGMAAVDVVEQHISEVSMTMVPRPRPASRRRRSAPKKARA